MKWKFLFWSAISLSVPYSILKSNEDCNQIIEYHNEEINDTFIKLILYNVYQHFTLINGPIDKLWLSLDQNRDQFISICCEFFFDNIVPQIKLSPINLIEIYSAIQYLSLDSITFMSTQSFVNHVMCIDYKSIRYTMFLYNDQLVCSSLALNDTKTVYNYLINVVIPKAVCQEISGQQSVKRRWIRKEIKVYLHESEHKFYEMNLYRSINGSTLVLFLLQSNERVLAKCDALMCTRIIGLTTKLSQIAIKITANNNCNID